MTLASMIAGCSEAQEPELHAACRLRSTTAAEVKALVVNGADVNATHQFEASDFGNKDFGELVPREGKFTPLQLAAMFSNTEVIKALLQAGAQVTTPGPQGISTLHLASRFGSAESVQALVESGADPGSTDLAGNTALHAAAQNPDPGPVTYLLGSKLEPNPISNNGSTPTHFAAARNTNPKILIALITSGSNVQLKRQDGSTPLHMACANTDLDLSLSVNVLLEAGADPNSTNASGRTPLMEASRGISTETIRLLLAAGARVDTRDSDGSTVLHDAARSTEPAILEMLIAEDLDVNTRDHKNSTPLHVAAYSPDFFSRFYFQYDWEAEPQLEKIRLLLNAGADPNARDSTGNTPLHNAADDRVRLQKSTPAVVFALIKAGADPNIRNEAGETPLDLANDDEIKSVLRAAGGKSRFDLIFER